MDAVTNLCGISARPRSVFALAAGLLLAALSSGAPLAAQQPKYEELPLDTRLDDERSTLHREIKTLVAKIHRGDTPLEPDAGKFDAWYTRYLFPKMTQISNLAEIPTLRQRFLQSDLERSSSQAAHDRLVRLTLTNMQAVAQGNYHPAARHNAMLIIGELNGREAIRVGNAQPPLPYVDAVNVMLEELESETQIDAVRVAALIGLLRHVELDRMRPSDQRMPEAGRVRFLERMLAIASAPPPAGRSPEGHAWMQRRAVQIIGELGSPGAENAAVVALRKLAADNAQPLDLRTQAAESLGKIIYPTLPAETGAQMASELALVLHASCKAELDRLMREKKEEEEYKKRLALLGGGGNVKSERDGFRGLPGSGSQNEGTNPEKLLQWANVRAAGDRRSG